MHLHNICILPTASNINIYKDTEWPVVRVKKIDSRILGSPTGNKILLFGLNLARAYIFTYKIQLAPKAN